VGLCGRQASEFSAAVCSTTFRTAQPGVSSACGLTRQRTELLHPRSSCACHQCRVTGG
jgi:hypothetical protein